VNHDLNMQLIEQLTAVQTASLTSFDTICQQIHTVLNTQLPDDSHIAFYLADDNTYELVAHTASTDDSKPSVIPSDDDTLQEALTATRYVILQQDVYLPITHDSQLYGVFCVMLSDDGTASQISWQIVQQILQHYSQVAISYRTSQSEQSELINYAYEISLAENDHEVIEHLFSATPHAITHIGIYRFSTDVTVENPPLSADLRVIADREKTLASDEMVLFSGDPHFPTDIIQHLIDGQFIIEQDMTSIESALPQALLNTLKTMPIQSFIMTGLRVSQQLRGILLLGCDQNISFDADSHRDFRMLADQIGITFENRRLLRRTEVSLMESQVQYAISNDLMQSKSLPDMLRVLLRYFGENADGAGIVEIEYDNQDIVKDAVIRVQMKQGDTHITEPNTSVTEYVDIDDLHNLQTAWSMSEIPVYFIEDDEDVSPQLPLTIFVQQGIASCILIPLTENRLVTHVISINWSNSRTFPERTRRLLNAIRSQLDIIYQNQQLLQHAQVTSSRLAQQVQTQRALNDLANFAGSNQDEQLLLDKSAETLKNILHVDHIGIMLIDETDNTAYLASEYPVEATEEIRIPYEGEIWEQLKNGEHVYIESVDETPNTQESQHALKSIGVKSSMFIPFLDLSGKLVGSVGLDAYERSINLTDEQIQTARLVNAQIVTQLQNLRLLQDSQRLAGQMQQIARFGETVQSRLEIEEILQTTLHFAKRIVSAEYVSVTLYDEQAEKLVVRAYYLDDIETVTQSNAPVMSSSDTVVGEVWRNRESQYIPLLSESDYTNPLSDKITSVFAVALISRGVTRGVLEMGHTTKKPIQAIEQSALVQLANQLAVALENAKTYSQSQRLAQNKVLANEISLQLQQQIDIDGLLNTTVTELGKALGAKRARIRLGVQQVVENK